MGRLRALSCPPMGSSYWPLLGIFMSASGQFFMSADIDRRVRLRRALPSCVVMNAHSARYSFAVEGFRLAATSITQPWGGRRASVC